MKKERSEKTKKNILLVTFLLLSFGIIGGISALIVAVNQQYRGYKVGGTTIQGVVNTGQYGTVTTNTTFAKIKEFGICHVVSSSSANSIFVPTRTQTERSTFITRKPSHITLGTCGCYNDSDCLAGQLCQGETTGTSPYCQGTFSVPTTNYSCQSDGVATPSCWKNGYQITASDMDDCTTQRGTPGFYFKGTFYNAMMTCMMDENSTQRSDLICPYPCSSLAQSQCTSPGCTWTSSTSYQTYSCNQPITTTTARCTGKEVPLSEQHCYTSLNPISPMVAASDYWDCVGQGNYWAFYFNGQDYNASSVCMMEAWEGGEVSCFYPCRGLTQSQCTTKPTQCSRTTTTTTVSPNECWDRSGCSRNSGTLPQAGTCSTQVCGNDIKEGTEICDILDLGIPCTTSSGKPGTKYCNSTCNGYTTCVADPTPPSSTCTPKNCFIAGTQIKMADGTTKPIEEITTEDFVYSISGQKNKVIGTLKKNDTNPLYAFNNSNHYFVTEAHPFLTLNGWKSMNPSATSQENPGLMVTQLSIGDILITESGTVVLFAIDSIPNKEGTYVYNITVENTHDYYADGYAVHNKLQCADIGLYPCNGGMYCAANASACASCVNACDPCTQTAQCPVNYYCKTQEGMCFPSNDPTYVCAI